MVCLGGEKLKLAKGKSNKKEALKRFHELMARTVERPESPDARVADVAEAFLEFSRRNHAPDTYRNHRFYIQSFCEKWGYLSVRNVKPFHVTRWVEERDWNDTSEYNGRRFVFRIFSWAVQEGILDQNPLQGMKRPRPMPHRRALLDDELDQLLEATDECFHVFLFSLRHTGARPKEQRDLTWDQVREDRWVMWKHKTDRDTRKPRVIYLNEKMKKLMAEMRRNRNGSEHVFLNSRGKPWTQNAVRLRISRLKKKLGLARDVSSYLLRHAFGT